MLVDDNPHDNFFHERIISQYNPAIKVLKMESAVDALDYLNTHSEKPLLEPDIIFLDINMPYMNGWEFVEEYKKLDGHLKNRFVIVMLSTSEYPSERAMAAHKAVIANYVTKPLTLEALEDIDARFFGRSV